MEIQTLKYTIVDLQKELQVPTATMMEIPIIPNETELREEEQEKEIKKPKVELDEFTNQFNHKRQENYEQKFHTSKKLDSVFTRQPQEKPLLEKTCERRLFYFLLQNKVQQYNQQ